MVTFPPDFCPYCGGALEPVEVEGRERDRSGETLRERFERAARTF